MSLLKNSLTFISVNINGCNTNFDYLLSNLQALNIVFDFLILTEIKLSKDTDTNKLFEIPNYNHYTVYRNTHGGGIRIYYRQSLDVMLCEEYSQIFESHESLFVKVKTESTGNFYIGCFYRPPRCSIAEFNNYVENNIFGDHNLVTSKCLFLGDFNINIDANKDHDYQTKNYLNIMKSNHFDQYVNDLTRCDGGNFLPVSLLDHIWANFGQDAEASILDCLPSDHFAVFFKIKTKIENCILKIKFRDFSQENVDKLNNNLNALFGNYTVDNDVNVEVEFERFVTYLTEVLNKYFPVRTKQISCKRIKMPWLTTDVIQLINKKHRLFRALKQGYITQTYFKAYSRLLKLLIDRLKQNYFKSQFNHYKNNQRKTWQTINNICGRGRQQKIKAIQTSDGQLISDNGSIAAEFNSYFANIPINVQDSLENSNQNYDHLVSVNDRSMYFIPIESNEVNGVINRLDVKKENNDLSPKFFKLCKDHICGILSILFNKCVDRGIYPKILKVARIAPIFKAGNKLLVANYRPVSILSTLNKIFEKCIYKRLDNFLSHCNIISENQFGFMKSRDTQQAALKFVVDILSIYTTGECAAGLFLDFSKAFDTIDRKRLLFKAYRCGIRGPILNLLDSYLSSRFHYTSINGESSSLIENKIGVPQGSCLGPLLFNIYINDFQRLLKNVLMILFADDSTVIVKSNNLTSLAFKLNFILYKINDWCNSNKLALNVNKTKIMVFNSKKKLLPRVTLDSKDVEVVRQYKYLGFVLDNSLKHTQHILKLIGKMRQYRAVTFKIGKFFNLDTAKTFYYTMIYSHLCYGTIIWAGTLKTANFKKLEALQDKIIKNLFCRHLPNMNLSSIYKRLKILKLKDIYKLKICLTMYKCLYCNYLPYIQTVIAGLIRDHVYETRSRSDYLLPVPNVKSVELNLVYQMLKAWNTLDVSLRESQTLNLLKRNLMHIIFDSY